MEVEHAPDRRTIVLLRQQHVSQVSLQIRIIVVNFCVVGDGNQSRPASGRTDRKEGKKVSRRECQPFSGAAHGAGTQAGKATTPGDDASPADLL